MTSEVNDVPSKTVKVLLIEDNPGDAGLIREALREATATRFDLECADRLASGLEHLVGKGADIVLLDLSLPDSQGLGTFVKVHTQSPDVPIIVLTGLDDKTVAVGSVREGAQDYLVKGQVDGNLLERAIHYAIERHKMMLELRNLSLTDELTGLHNRRGFTTLAQQQLKFADRTEKGMLLLFADLDKMKWINDTLGHQEGDQALIGVAKILKATFRDSDIVARVGGDEFAVLAINADEDSIESIASRLQENLDTFNASEKRGYNLSLSTGMTRYDPEQSCSLDQLISRGDELMYEQKRGKNGQQIKQG